MFLWDYTSSAMSDDEQDIDIPAEELARRSIFASHVARGSAIPDALHAAGYSSNALHLGWTLLSYPDVRVEVDRHRQYIRDKQARSVGELIEQLDRDREFAIETRNAATAVAATLAQARILGALDPATAALKAGQKRLVLTWGGEDLSDITPERIVELLPLQRTGTEE
jgi:hypothetical protein